MVDHHISNTLRLVYLALFFGLLTLAYIILKPFLVPLGWSVILVISTWPIFKKLQQWNPNRAGFNAAFMCFLITAVILVIFVPISMRLSAEAKEATKYITHLYQHEQLEVPAKYLQMPYLGEQVEKLQEQWNTHRIELINHVLTYQNQILAFLKAAAKGVGQTFFILFIAIFSAYFLFYNGEELVKRLMKASKNIGGDSLANFILIIHSTIIATFYGVILTSIAQGVLAGIGFYIVGAPAPVLLGIVITFMSFIPFGPPFLYIPVIIALAFMGWAWGWIVFLTLWCVLVVSMADNVLRPLFISHATSMSLLLVLLGILGGIASFGMIGIFIGPVVIAVAQKVWVEFTKAEVLKEHFSSHES